MRYLPGILFIVMAIGAQASPLNFPPLNVAAVDPLIKVFRDDVVAGEPAAHSDSARGEHASFQVVVTSCPVDLKSIRCEVTPFTRDGGSESLPVKSVRYVGHVGSSISGKTTASDILRIAPAMYPDPLLEVNDIDVEAGSNQSIWISVKVPENAQPGDYHATSTVTARLFGVDTSATLPLSLRVYPATITDTRLNVTLWYQMYDHHDWKMPERYTDAWYDVIRGYVKSMVEHRENWGWIETLEAMKFSRDSAGKLQVDFTNFDKWMQVLFDGGLEKIEGQHFAFRTKGWLSPFGVSVYSEKDGEWKAEKMAPDSAEAEEFYAAYFPAFQAHLEEKGWLDKYVQHVADEPLDKNVDSYTTAAALLKKYAPKIPIMEACQTEKLVGTVDIWIPQLDHFKKGADFFQQRIEAGDEVWFYTCMYPAGEYANRFLELPLIKTRLLHWINYRYGATGYLHWGWNYWSPHPWENSARYSMAQLPGGDANIVYPKPGEPGVWSSIRYEAMRDGIEDHELLSQLGEKDAAAARELVVRHIHDFDKYETDVKVFRQTRRELLEKLSEMGQ